MSYTTLILGKKDIYPEDFSFARSLEAHQRRALAIKVLARTQPVAEIARQNRVSRKFLYQQAEKADKALEDAFFTEADDSRILFHLPVTKDWLRQFVLEMVLVCHAPYRGVMQACKDLLDTHISIGTVHNILRSAVQQARDINASEDLSGIKVGAHDEIFQAGKPILVGADVVSTYCYLLAPEQAHDADTWGVHLLDLEAKGLKPDYTIADGGKWLRAGQSEVWPDVPCHSDVFHPLLDMGRLAVYLENRALEAMATCYKLQRKMESAKKHARGNRFSRKLAAARKATSIIIEVADTIATVAKWLREDILAAVGPTLQTRRELFDFVVDEIRKLERFAPHRIGPVRRKLQNQRDDLLAFAALIDKRLVILADEYRVPQQLVRSVYELEGIPDTCGHRWQREAQLRSELRHLFHPIQQAVREIIAQTVRASSVIENLNSRLRDYFFLRRQLGPEYLELLRFFLNHRRFLRSEHPEREGRSPAEILTGRRHPHWLEILGYTRFKRAA